MATLGCGAAIVSLYAQKPPPLPPSQSGAPAKELVALMTAAKLDSLAVRDPGESGRYVAVLNVGGVELLVVSAKADASVLDYRLYQKDYPGAFQDLSSNISSTTKTLIDDQKCDGLVAAPAKGVMQKDRISVDGQDFVFDGDYKTRKMTAEEYQKRFDAADQAYVRMLNVLIAELKKKG
jgi:hypothetical protein